MNFSELLMFLAMHYRLSAQKDDPQVMFYDTNGHRYIFTDTVYTDDDILCFDMERVTA